MLGLLPSSMRVIFPRFFASANKAQTELQAAGLRVVGYTHYQFLLFPLVWLSRRLGSKQGRSSLEARPSLPLGRFLGMVNAFEVAMLSKFSLPFGSSLILLIEVS